MKLSTASDIMTGEVVSVGPDASLREVLRVFVEENIHGAPVVDDEGQLAGVITTSDLLRAQEDDRDTAMATIDYLQDVLEFTSPDWSGDVTDFQDRLGVRTVAEVMTKSVLSVPSDAPVAVVARCLRENQVHRVWVKDEGRLCGVVSALDLMAVVEEVSGVG
jgi:CBS domain-containing protein